MHLIEKTALLSTKTLVAIERKRVPKMEIVAVPTPSCSVNTKSIPDTGMPS